MVNGPESRKTLASSLKDVFDDVNEIQTNGYRTIDGKRVDIELFLGGDYKVIISHHCNALKWYYDENHIFPI